MAKTKKYGFGFSFVFFKNHLLLVLKQIMANTDLDYTATDATLAHSWCILNEVKPL